MIILGIDPGVATTGFGVIKTGPKRDIFLIENYGVIATPKSLNDAQRLEMLAHDLDTIVKTHRPEAAGLEKLFFSTNQKTAMSVSQARGVVLFTLQKHRIKILEFTPLQVKNFICGYGKADKKQVQFLVQKTFGLKMPPRPDDAADALAIALAAGFQASRQAGLP